ncbi:unnamed protein product [Peronospora belbahrii]|uniref:Uncharacterized protein n=1 Tax=Peronospora belbahrii TaxID=622444 RepID=A0ABN8CNI0_9STRA|nr:unnamed protein product [Peronospora belbahrii]
MSTTRNQHKRLYWYTVLAAITLLTYWSTLPKTADSDTVIAGSLQYALGIHQSNTRVKRHLRSSSDTTAIDVDDNEDRALRINFELPTLKFPDVAKKATQKAFDAFVITTLPKSQKANAIRFKRLNLDKVSSYEDAEKLAKSGNFEKWINGEIKVYKNTEKAEEAMVSTLVRLAGKDKAIMILAAGSKDLRTTLIATNLENRLLSQWMKDGRRNILYKLLTFGKTGLDFWESSQWKSFVAEAKRKKENEFDLLVEIFRPHSSDEKVFQILASGKTIPSVEQDANKLEKSLLKEWMKDSQYDGLYQLLTFGKTGQDFFTSPQWKLFFDETEKQTRFKLLGEILKPHSSDEKVFEILASGKTIPRVKQDVEELEKSLLREWIKYGQDDGLYQLLTFGKTGQDFWTSPQWKLFFDETDKQTRFKLLRKILKPHSSDEKVFEILASGKTIPKVKQDVEELEKSLRREWMKDGRYDGLYQLLTFGKTGHDFLTSSQWLLFVQEAERQQKNRFKLLVEMFKPHSGNDKVTRRRKKLPKVEEETLSKWMQKPDRRAGLFRLLFFDTANIEKLDASQIDFVFEKLGVPTKDRDELLFTALQSHLDDDDKLAELVAVSKRDDSSKELATRMELMLKSRGKSLPDELLQSPELSTFVAFGKLLHEDEQNKWKDVLLDKWMSKEPDLSTLEKIFAKHSNGINAEAVRVLKLRLLEKIKEEKLD